MPKPYPQPLIERQRPIGAFGLVRRSGAVSVLAAITLLPGCIKRSEIVAILPDGDVLMATLIEGEPKDVTQGDALPTEAAGWDVTDRIETDSDGDEKLHRAAYLRLPAGRPIPDSYAVAGSHTEMMSLRFTTQVTLEHTSTGTYYHFHRTYHGRPFAFLDALRKQRLESDAIKQILQKEPDVLTDGDRQTLARALLAWGRDRELAFFDKAADKAAGAVPQHVRLLARASLMPFHEDESAVERAAAALRDRQEADAGKALDALSADLSRRIETAVREVLAEHSVAPATVEAFFAARKEAEEYFEFTEDLGDESWWVAAVLPGALVAHRQTDSSKTEKMDLAALTEDAMEGLQPVVKELADLEFAPGFSSVTWTIEGEELFDRDVVLSASSFVPAAD